MYRLKALKKLPAKEFRSHNRSAGSALTLLVILLLASTSAHAQGSPFDTGFNALQTLFTGTIAKVASLIAIVIGGYGFAHGEPGAKKALAGGCCRHGHCRPRRQCSELAVGCLASIPPGARFRRVPP
jgi:type IV secretory pathway VirB2 component (pilin)